ITTTANEKNDRSSDLQETSPFSTAQAHEGDKLIQDSLQQIERMYEQSSSLTPSMNELRTKSAELTNIITLTTDIAEQPNLLAVNAYIESVHAGEQGKGFAVGAQENRRLAEQSTEATHQISNLVREIQTETLGAVERTNTSMDTIKEGSAIVEEAGNTFYEIRDSITEVVIDIYAMIETITTLELDYE